MKDLAAIAHELVLAQRTIAEQQRDIANQSGQIASLKRKLHSRDRLVEELALKCGRYKLDPQTAAHKLVEAHDRIRELQGQLKEKELQIAEMQRSGNRQAHPFRRRKCKPHSRHKKPGRRKRRGVFTNRPAPEKADIEETVALQKCPSCGCSELPDKKELVNWQIDLPPIQPEITRFTTQGCFCPDCSDWIQSRHPHQLSTAMGAANITIGPRAIAAAADMHERHGMSYEKIADVFTELLGFSITPSCLCKSLDRLLARSEHVYAELVDSIRRCSAVHADETGWRIGTLNAWLWVFTNSELCVYTVRSGSGARGHQVVIEMLGKRFSGILISDCLATYDQKSFIHWLKQKCCSHLLKDFAELSMSQKAQAAALGIAVCAFIKKAMTLKKSKEQFQENEYEKHCAALEVELDQLLMEHEAVTEPDSLRLLNRIRKQRYNLLTFLYHDEVDATNNLAERDLRPAVISRKTQGCNKTVAGARKHAILASIIVTARKQGKAVTDTLTQIQRSTLRRLTPI